MFDNPDIPKSKHTLLYAEDEPEVRSVYKTFFETYFENVLVAENGKEAWDLYLTNKPSVVILDIKMPELNGIEVAKKIREQNKDAIIIIITANDTREWLIQAVELNLTKFIKKGAIKLVEFEALLLNIIEELDRKMSHANTEWEICKSPLIVWDNATQKLYKNGEYIELTKKLTQIINYFSLNKNRVISHEEIARELWGDKPQTGKTPVAQKIRTFLYTIKNYTGVGLFKSHYNQGYTLELVNDES